MKYISLGSQPVVSSVLKDCNLNTNSTISENYIDEIPLRATLINIITCIFLILVHLFTHIIPNNDNFFGSSILMIISLQFVLISIAISFKLILLYIFSSPQLSHLFSNQISNLK